MADDTSTGIPKTLGQLVQSLRKTFADRALVPFQLRKTPANAQVMGMGRVFIVTATAGTATPVTHMLGRVPTFALLLDNGAAVQTPLQITARTATTITIKPTGALTAALVWVC